VGLVWLGVLVVLGAWLVPLGVVGVVWGCLVPAPVRVWWREWRTARRRAVWERDVARGLPVAKRFASRVDDIPEWVFALACWAWGNVCAGCRSAPASQSDHVRPFKAGGLMVWWNFAPLCRDCNRVKSDFWRWRWRRRVEYHPWPGSRDPQRAELILSRERWRRLSPVVLFRVWWWFVVGGGV
jgi:hypothetical protein